MSLFLVPTRRYVTRHLCDLSLGLLCGMPRFAAVPSMTRLQSRSSSNAWRLGGQTRSHFGVVWFSRAVDPFAVLFRSHVEFCTVRQNEVVRGHRLALKRLRRNTPVSGEKVTASPLGETARCFRGNRCEPAVAPSQGRTRKDRPIAGRQNFTTIHLPLSASPLL